MVNNKDRCYFCGAVSQYNFDIDAAICTDHFYQIQNYSVPEYIPKSQIFNFKKMKLQEIMRKTK